MKTITTKWNSGNFSLSHSAEVDDATMELLAAQGLLWFAQRNREHDKVLGAFHAVNGKQVRIKDWKRGDVDYSTADGAKLKAVYGSFDVSDTVKLPIVTEVGEYVRDVAEPKYAAAKAAMARHESADDLEAWLEGKIGFKGEPHGADGEYNVEALKAIDGFVKAQLAAI